MDFSKETSKKLNEYDCEDVIDLLNAYGKLVGLYKRAKFHITDLQEKNKDINKKLKKVRNENSQILNTWASAEALQKKRIDVMERDLLNALAKYRSKIGIRIN